MFSHRQRVAAACSRISGDTLILRVAYGEKKRLFFIKGRPEEITLAHNDIADMFKEQGQGEYTRMFYSALD